MGGGSGTGEKGGVSHFFLKIYSTLLVFTSLADTFPSFTVSHAILIPKLSLYFPRDVKIPKSGHVFGGGLSRPHSPNASDSQTRNALESN